MKILYPPELHTVILLQHFVGNQLRLGVIDHAIRFPLPRIPLKI
ncbi:hypothetical protein [Nitrosospira multiformis]|jgi:hypothetical protein|uniref:Uncharacterized protein n=1 Tax=Nitrosospira multiformis TaxID=1231 RepID=A0A1I7IGP0_9PROT|nr:hypothetical protein [Nitrosospira multiformis]SFU72104.1 hypothetical protein SAMN05216417_11952 [Nitrosospira multiformis]